MWPLRLTRLQVSARSHPIKAHLVSSPSLKPWILNKLLQKNTCWRAIVSMNVLTSHTLGAAARTPFESKWECVTAVRSRIRNGGGSFVRGIAATASINRFNRVVIRRSGRNVRIGERQCGDRCRVYWRGAFAARRTSTEHVVSHSASRAGAPRQQDRMHSRS